MLVDLLALFVAAIAGKIFDNAIGFIVAYATVKFVEYAFKRRKFGNWTLRVIAPDGSVGTERKVGMKKMEQILDDESDMSVFIKGVTSTFGWLNCDPVVKGREIGLLVVDNRRKLIIVDLTKNPPAPAKQAPKG